MSNIKQSGSGSSLTDGKTAGLHKEESPDVADNVHASTMEGQSATPLYDQLVEGVFNSLHWKQFVSMCGRIAEEENVPWTDIHEYILAWMDKNESLADDSADCDITAASDNGNTVVYRAVRKALKNMPLDEAEQHAFEQWQSDIRQAARSGSYDSEVAFLWRKIGWFKPVLDIIDGRYDNDTEKIVRLLDAAYAASDDALCGRVFRRLRIDYFKVSEGLSQATKHLTEVLMVQAKKLGFEHWRNLKALTSRAENYYQGQLRTGMKILSEKKLSVDDIRVAQKKMAEALKKLSVDNSQLLCSREDQVVADGSPAWLSDMYDIINGRYDNDIREMRRLLYVAGEEIEKPGCDPWWDKVANQAADHWIEILRAQRKTRDLV